VSRKDYHQEYFQKNKAKINARSRKNYQAKKESHQTQLFEESAAPPVKVEQQTVSSREEANSESISNVEELFPEKPEISEFAMVGNGNGLIGGPESDPRRTTQAQLSSPGHDNARDISIVEGPTVEGKTMRVVGKLLKESSVELLKDKNVEGIEPNVEGKVLKDTIVEGKLPNVEANGADLCKNEMLLIGEGAARRPLSHFFVSAGILLLLTANTFFLVTEQASLYESMGYKERMPLFLAILTEIFLIALSLLGNWTNDPVWKIALFSACGMTVAVVLNVLDASAHNRGAKITAQSEQVIAAKKRIAALEPLEAAALAAIKGLDPKVYPTKIRELSRRLNSPGPEGYSLKIENLRKELAGKAATSQVSETRVMIWQRRVSMACNLILSGFLGSLWRRRKKKSEVWSKLFSWVREYWKRPCRV
jgi:hypothetical protein